MRVLRKTFEILREKNLHFSCVDDKVTCRDDYDNVLCYMRDLPEPENDVERSFAQYLCQRYYFSRYKKIILNLEAILMFFPLLLYFLCKRKPLTLIENNVAVYTLNERYKDFLPVKLIQQFVGCYSCQFHSGFSLKWQDIRFIFKIWKRYPWHFFFIFKNMMKIAFYRDMMDRYAPSAIITNNEYSFTSSILTQFCEKNNIRHINVMHGERGLEVRASFFRYHKCYVWDDFYINIFLKLRAVPEQFVIAIPPALQVDKQMLRKPELLCDFKYYLQNPDSNELKQIADIVRQISSYGFKIKVRPHPLYNTKAVCSYFDNRLLETSDMPIAVSLANTKAVIGAGSTVLLQAYYSRIAIFWDDIVFGDVLEKIAKNGYILSDKKIERLSVFFNNIQYEGVDKSYYM